MNWENCEEVKNSFTTAINGRGLISWVAVMVAGSKVDILSLIILSMRIKPTRKRFCSSSDNVLTRRLPKWSTWSGFEPGVLFNLITSFTTSTKSSMVKIRSSFSMSFAASPFVGAMCGKRCQVFQRPTFDRS